MIYLRIFTGSGSDGDNPTQRVPIGVVLYQSRKAYLLASAYLERVLG